jgi:hypothetical protein
MHAETVRGAVDSLAGSRGRSMRHLLAGVALTGGAVLVSALIARKHAPTEDNPEIYSDYEELEQPPFKPPRKLFTLVWPPLFLALTLSGLRIWNAPSSAARTQALTLWGVVHALNAVAPGGPADRRHGLARHLDGLCLAGEEGGHGGRRNGRALHRLDRLRQRAHRGGLAPQLASADAALADGSATP